VENVDVSLHREKETQAAIDNLDYCFKSTFSVYTQSYLRRHLFANGWMGLCQAVETLVYLALCSSTWKILLFYIAFFSHWNDVTRLNVKRDGFLSEKWPTWSQPP
jgi:hypothetical protein